MFFTSPLVYPSLIFLFWLLSFYLCSSVAGAFGGLSVTDGPTAYWVDGLLSSQIRVLNMGIRRLLFPLLKAKSV